MAERCTVDRSLLPVKALYFLITGSIFTLTAFIPVVSKHLSLPTAAFGSLILAINILKIFVRPLIGMIVDKLQNLKFILLFCNIAAAVATVGITFIPAAFESLSFVGNVTFDNSTALMSTTPELSACLASVLNRTKSNCILSCSNNETGSLLTELNSGLNEFPYITLQTAGYNISVVNVLCSVRCGRGLHQCIESDNEYIFPLIPFTLFSLTMIIFNLVVGAELSLISVVCFRRLKSKSYLFGRQFMWATIGLGISSPLAGYIVDLTSSGNDGRNSDVSAAMYYLATMLTLGTLIIAVMDIAPSKKSQSMLKDIREIIRRWEVGVFLADAFVMGILVALYYNFYFLHLQNLGAEKSLMGLNLAVGALLGSVPIQLIYGTLIKKFNHAVLIKMSFVAVSLRYFFHSLYVNPWWSLLIELLQGPSLALFSTCMPDYTNSISSEGVQATLQLLSQTIHLAIGAGLGSLLAGFSFQILGYQSTFQMFALIAILWGIFSGCLHYFLGQQRSQPSKEIKILPELQKLNREHFPAKENCEEKEIKIND